MILAEIVAGKEMFIYNTIRQRKRRNSERMTGIM
jgi:hypothetical protein